MDTALSEWGRSVTDCFAEWRDFVRSIAAGETTAGAAAGGGASAAAASAAGLLRPSHRLMMELCHPMLDDEPTLTPDAPTRIDYDSDVSKFNARLAKYAVLVA